MKIASYVLGCALAFTLPVQARAACWDSSGARGERYHVLWHDKGLGCLTLGKAGSYRSRWSLGLNGNMVAGLGWTNAVAGRVVQYRAKSFVPGKNGYLSLYGWSVHPLVEYYIVDDYGPFVPPGHGGVLLGSLDSDGGRYNIYRTQRVNAPSIAGTTTFYQYWSVRTTPRAVASVNTITFANHVQAWRAVGLNLGTLKYQIVATEGFGSRGRSDVTVTSK